MRPIDLFMEEKMKKRLWSYGRIDYGHHPDLLISRGDRKVALFVLEIEGIAETDIRQLVGEVWEGTRENSYWVVIRE